MPKAERLEDKIFRISGLQEFNDSAVKIFQYQYKNNPVYEKFIRHLRVDTGLIRQYTDIPFLPIEFFKSHRVQSGDFIPAADFSSSGTTGAFASHHFVRDLNIYEMSFLKSFRLFYGDPEDIVILALLPSYLERKGSSLVYMADRLIKISKQPESGFYLDDYGKLSGLLMELRTNQRKVILLGVTFALLDLADRFPVEFPELIIMETGGMKGRRKELTKAEVHEKLKKTFAVPCIHTEYKMTELLSQAYSGGDGTFYCPPWMKVLIRDVNDPLTLLPHGKAGGINIIDLANLHSCSFLATQDLGRTHADGSFEILGRFDHSDVRGCNLMVV